MTLLTISNVSKMFGKLAALEDINLEINEGEVVGIVGPNGSGKTTLINVMSGFYRPTTGQIIYDGKRISGLRPDQICSRGVMRTFQSNVLYRDATVITSMIRASFMNLKAGSWAQFLNTSGFKAKENELWKKSAELLDVFGLSKFRDMRALDLPHGSQRILGIAMAVVTHPRLLLLDEPMTGMNDEETMEVVSLIGKLRQQGITIILVEHNMKALLNATQRLIVLNFGHKIADGRPEHVVDMNEVIECYLGTEVI